MTDQHPTDTDNRAELEAALRRAVPDADTLIAHWTELELPYYKNCARPTEDFIRKRIDAALSSPPSDQERGLEEAGTAWLIERDDIATVESQNKVCLHYYAEWGSGKHYWTPDHMKAKRFADEVLARAETNGDPLLRVAEHMWINNRPQPTVEHAAPQAEVERVARALHRVEMGGPNVEEEWGLFQHAARAAIAALSPSSSTEEKIVAWLRSLANADLTPSILAFFCDPWGDDGQRLCGELADAIERGEAR